MSRVADAAATERTLGNLARGSVAGFGVYAAGAGLTYAAQLVLARLAGPQAYGDYAFVFACMTMLAYLAAFGFDVSLLRFVPIYREQRAWGHLRGVIRYADRCALALGTALGLAGAAVVVAAGARLHPQLRLTFLAGFPLLPVWALLWVRSAVVRAGGKVVAALAPDRIVRDGSLVLILCAAYAVLQRHVSAPFAMLATLAGSVLGLLLVTRAKRRVGGLSIAAAPQEDKRAWRRAAFPLVAMALAETAINRTGVVLLGWLAGTTEAGIYAVAFSLAFLVVLPRTALNALFAPTISALHVRGDRHALQVVIGRTALWNLLGATAIALPMALLGHFLLGWFGRDFGAALPILRILLIGQVVAAAAGSQTFLLTMTGQERSAAVLLVASTVGNVALTAALILLIGPLGAAIASTATLVASNVAMALMIWYKLGLRPGLFACRNRSVALQPTGR